MKRNTFFLLAYSIIIALVTSLPVDTDKTNDLTSISVEQYQNRCAKYSKNNFTKVLDYIKKCTDPGGAIHSPTELIPHICFGVVNNILFACDNAAVNVLQFVNDMLTKKNFSLSVNSSICPLEISGMEEFLERDSNFFNMTKFLKQETVCKVLCYDLTSVPQDNCLLWYKTNKMLQNIKNQSTAEGKKSNQETGDLSSQGSNKGTGVGLESTENKPTIRKNIPSPVKPNSGSRGVTVPQQNQPEHNHDKSKENPAVKETKDEQPGKQQMLHAETNPNQSGKTELEKTPAPKNPESKKSVVPSELVDSPPSPELPEYNINQEDLSPDQNTDFGKIPNTSVGDSMNLDGDKPYLQPDLEDKASTSNIPGNNAIINGLDNDKYPPGGDDDDDDNPLQVEGTPEKKKIAEVETSPSKTVSSNYISYTDSAAEEDSHFYVYFFTSASIVIMGYVAFHNKNKILAYALEGRRNRNSRRRPNSASYRKLDCSLEEAITSNASHASVTNVVY